ncbi:MAG: hypothetical protein U9P90_01190 [Patescibacteria group bacterium]|nr:hypothetical protein [Patescibacteria group bacterium]
MTEQKQIDPRMVDLQAKALSTGGLFFGNLMIGDVVEITTLNSVYKVEILSSVSEPRRRVRMQKKSTKSNDHRFENPMIFMTRGTYCDSPLFSGWIFLNCAFYLEYLGGKFHPMCLSNTKSVSVNGVRIL